MSTGLFSPLFNIQAKRWDNVVGRPEIQKFAGALLGRKAEKGIFITTSGYTQEALDYAQSLENKVVLIDGVRLAQLMIEHNSGKPLTLFLFGERFSSVVTMPPAAGVQTAAAVHKSGSAPRLVSSRHIRVALRAVTGEIAANPQDTMSWGLAALGGGGQEDAPVRLLLWVLCAGSVLSIQHLQKHWILERNRHFAELEVALLSSVVLSECFAEYLDKCLTCQDPEDQISSKYPRQKWHKGVPLRISANLVLLDCVLVATIELRGDKTCHIR